MAAKRGRPSTYTSHVGDKICDLLAQGYSLRQIGSRDDMPQRHTIIDWALRHDEFATQYARARQMQAEHWSDEILEIADDASNDWMTREGKDVLNGEHVQRSKLRYDARRWLMSKLAPKKFGERVVTEHVGKDGGAIQTETTSRIDVSKLSAEDRKKWRDLIAKAEVETKE